MKPTSFRLIIPAIWISILALFIFISCGQNRLKTDEKTLAKQILTEEEQLGRDAELLAEREKQLTDSIAKLPKGFRFKEDRSVDLNNPPVVIDIAGNRSNQHKISLSQLFGKVEYIRLEQDPDSMFYEFSWFHEFKFHMIVGVHHIYTLSALGGIFQFDLKGHFIQSICKGNLQYNSFKGGAVIGPEQINRFEGAQSVYWYDNKLHYQYENRPEKKTYLMTFDDNVNSENSSVLLAGSVESKNQINGKGEIKAELKKNSSALASPTPYMVNRNLLSFAPKRDMKHKTNFLNVISSSGDTLSVFKDNDPIKNFSKPHYREFDYGTNYYLNGTLHLRQSLNDTIYQLISPNRLVPKYILNFGSLGIKSTNEGVDPDINLKDKLVPRSFLETDRYLFITYSKDYDCPSTARNGTLKYSRLIYDKKNKTLKSIYIDEAPYVSEIDQKHSAPNINLENDFDGMPFIWPTSVTANGNPCSIISGEDLLKIKNQNLPVKNIRNNDRIIAIYH